MIDLRPGERAPTDDEWRDALVAIVAAITDRPGCFLKGQPLRDLEASLRGQAAPINLAGAVRAVTREAKELSGLALAAIAATEAQRPVVAERPRPVVEEPAEDEPVDDVDYDVEAAIAATREFLRPGQVTVPDLPASEEA